MSEVLPVGRPGHPRGYYQRDYPEPIKVGAIILAVNEGVSKAADTLNIPRRTLRLWVERAGGLAELCRIGQLAAEQSLSAARSALGNEVRRRASKLSEENLITAFTESLKAEEQARQATTAPASAQVVVVVGGERVPLAVEADTPSQPPGEGAIEATSKQLPETTS